MKKKKWLVILIIIVLLLLIPIGKSVWDELLSNILPWTRTFFSDYQKYEELLNDQHFFATVRFIDEIPADSGEVKYYVYRRYKEKKAAHSIKLSEDKYTNIVKSQMEPYLQDCDEYGIPLVYVIGESEKWTVVDLREKEIEVDFLDNVMQEPENIQDYYCLVIIRNGPCYTGVIANDTTHEMIEFSVEMPDEY